MSTRVSGPTKGDPVTAGLCVDMTCTGERDGRTMSGRPLRHGSAPPCGKDGGGARDFGHEQGGSVAMARRAPTAGSPDGRQETGGGKGRTAGIERGQARPAQRGQASPARPANQGRPAKPARSAGPAGSARAATEPWSSEGGQRGTYSHDSKSGQSGKGGDGTQGGDGAQGDDGTHDHGAYEDGAQEDHGAYNDGAEGDHRPYDHGRQPVGDWMCYPVHGSNRTGPRGFSNSIGSM